MDLSKYKSFKKGAGKKVAEIFGRGRNKQPSDELVQIISEVGLTESEKNYFYLKVLPIVRLKTVLESDNNEEGSYCEH